MFILFNKKYKQIIPLHKYIINWRASILIIVLSPPVTVYNRVMKPINKMDSVIVKPVIVSIIIAVAKNLTPSANILVIKNVTEANFCI